MKFSEIIGQDVAKRILQTSLTHNRIAQAYLFTGPGGVGKETTALTFARALNCQHPHPDGDACGKCSPCRKIEKGTNPDVELITPQKNSLKISQIRKLRVKASFKPMESKFKVYVIADTEKLTTEAANCFLKTLEEPPEKTVIILLTSYLSLLLPTIISRCQLIRFSPLPTSKIEETLQHNLGITLAKAKLFARLSGGSLGRAVAYSTRDLSATRTMIDDLWADLKKQNYKSLFKKTQVLAAEKEQLNWFFDIFLQLLRENFFQKGDISGYRQSLEVILTTKNYITKYVNTDLALNTMFLQLLPLAEKWSPQTIQNVK